MVSALCILICIGSPAEEAATPSLFLELLSEAPVEEWVNLMTPETNQIQPDSVSVRIEEFLNLSVDPGECTLEDFDGGYRAVFQESRWTWKLSGGRIGSVTGKSVVEWRPGGYRWQTVPLFTDDGATVGPKETLCAGVTAMGAILITGIVAIWYTKRRYS